jgi:glycosyltransferase involved in cell wall biosynthesis
MEEAQAGIFVEPENAADLADAITELVSNPTLRQSLGRNGRKHILDKFSRQQTAEEYVVVLQSLLGEKLPESALAA